MFWESIISIMKCCLTWVVSSMTASRFTRVVMTEMKPGQYIKEFRELLPDKKINFLGQMNREMIKPDQNNEIISHGICTVATVSVLSALPSTPGWHRPSLKDLGKLTCDGKESKEPAGMNENNPPAED